MIVGADEQVFMLPIRFHETIATEQPALHSETGRLLKIHLANHLAGAILLPCRAFFEQVQRTRYDVDRSR